MDSFFLLRINFERVKALKLSNLLWTAKRKKEETFWGNF